MPTGYINRKFISSTILLILLAALTAVSQNDDDNFGEELQQPVSPSGKQFVKDGFQGKSKWLQYKLSRAVKRYDVSPDEKQLIYKKNAGVKLSRSEKRKARRAERKERKLQKKTSELQGLALRKIQDKETLKRMDKNKRNANKKMRKLARHKKKQHRIFKLFK